jgi:hypothetical protein
MKSLSNISVLAVLIILLAPSCKKKSSTTLTQSTTPPNIENSWWHASDNSEHCFFNSNGAYYYLKGPFLLSDTALTNWKGTWNWQNNDTLNINYSGVQQGICVVSTLLADTMKLDVNITGNYPLRGYHWQK